MSEILGGLEFCAKKTPPDFGQEALITNSFLQKTKSLFLLFALWSVGHH